MTEEIIVNDVDVAGCSLYLKDNGKCLRLLTDNEPETECNAICDYGCLYHKEQLTRLEQDSKQLTQWLDEARRNADFWCDKCTSLEQENKELKKEIEKLKGVDGSVHPDSAYYKITRLEQENKQMKSVLEEIKNSVINYLPKENYKFARSFNPEEFELLENILNKINEVLNNEA